MFCIVVFDKPKMWQMICSSSKCLRHFHMPFCTSLSLSASSRVVILSLAYPCRCSDQWHHDTLRSDRGILCKMWFVEHCSSWCSSETYCNSRTSFVLGATILVGNFRFWLIIDVCRITPRCFALLFLTSPRCGKWFAQVPNVSDISTCHFAQACHYQPPLG